MHSSLQTVVIVLIFALCYLYFTARETARQRLDLYDLIMLSAVAIIPSAFVLLPIFAEWIAKISGVAFPFVIMFGLLFAILFIFIHRLTAKIHRLEYDNRLLIQEVSIIKSKIVKASKHLQGGGTGEN
jgi:hypothetical protein